MDVLSVPVQDLHRTTPSLDDPSTDTVLEIDRHELSVLASSHREAAATLERQTITNMQDILIQGLTESTGSRIRRRGRTHDIVANNISGDLADVS